MPNYKLNYFNGRGRAELVRLIFAAAGTTFTDNRIADWPATKDEQPLGQLPTMDVDGTKLVQSIAIARFAARECNLAGPDNLRQAQADAIVDTVMELVNAYYSKIFPIKDETEKAEAFKAFMADQGAKGSANIEKLISLYGSNGYAVGNSLTWADLLVFEIASSLFAKHPEFAEKFPHIAGVQKTVSANGKVSEYVKNRPVTPF